MKCVDLIWIMIQTNQPKKGISEAVRENLTQSGRLEGIIINWVESDNDTAVRFKSFFFF